MAFQIIRNDKTKVKADAIVNTANSNGRRNRHGLISFALSLECNKITMNETIDYYERNAADFACNTTDLEFSEIQDVFLRNLKGGATILDFGCGSGRDTKVFSAKGISGSGIGWICGIVQDRKGEYRDSSNTDGFQRF